MRHPDPLLMLADIARITAARPHLDEGLVRAICQHQALTSGRQPTFRQALVYVDHLTSQLDEVTLRAMLGLPPARAKRRRERTAATGSPSAAAPAPSVSASFAHRPGRPAWTADLFWVRYRKARDQATPPYTYGALSPHLEMLDGTVGTDAEYLRKLVRRYGLPPE